MIFAFVKQLTHGKHAKGVLSDFDIGCVQIAYDSLISLVTFIFENIISCRSGSISDIPKTSQTKS